MNERRTCMNCEAELEPGQKECPVCDTPVSAAETAPNQRVKKVSEKDLPKYSKHFDHNVAFRLLKKLRKATRDKPGIIAGPVGAIVVTLGKLLSAFDNPETPAPLKALIVCAIGYIILPVDLIPDIIPVVGYTDDLATAAGVVMAVAAYSNFDLKELDAAIDAERCINCDAELEPGQKECPVCHAPVKC